VKQAHVEWLRGRDACGTNAECPGQAMRERVDQLMQRQATAKDSASRRVGMRWSASAGID